MSTAVSEETNKENIGKAIGRIASGVYIVTAMHEGIYEGMLTTWLAQSGFAPPMLSMAVKKERPILGSLTHGARFAVNVLSKKNMEIFKHFAKPFAEGVDRFAGLNVDANISHAPVLTDSIAYMLCTVHSVVEAGDHCLVIGEVIDGGSLNPDDEPMVHLRKNGFQY